MQTEAERPEGRGAKKEVDPELYQYVLKTIVEQYPADEQRRRRAALHELLVKALKRYWQGPLQGKPFDTVGPAEREAMSDYIELLKDIGEVQYRLHKEIDFDQLTGLFRHDAFALHYENEVRRLSEAGEANTEMSMMVFIDLDYLKRINDTMGHTMGSLVIERLGKQLKDNVRATDAAGRFGGDEFVLMLTGVSRDKLYDTVERVFRACSGLVIARDAEGRHTVLSEAEFKERADAESLTVIEHVSLSMGVREIEPREALTLEGVLRYADQAAFTSKFHGRNAITVCMDKERGEVIRFRKGRFDASPKSVKLRKEGEYETREEHEETIRKNVDEALSRVLNCVRGHNKDDLSSEVIGAIQALQNGIIDSCAQEPSNYPIH